MQQQLDVMTAAIQQITQTPTTIYLYGSAVLDDYRAGWSDIDILCLTEKALPKDAALSLLHLRQHLQAEHQDPIYRAFEGGILSKNAFLRDEESIVVYWGTSGERLKTKHLFGCFSMMELLTNGIVLAGDDCRNEMRMPSFSDMRNGVIAHYNMVRKYAVKTEESITECGWLLDIARCIYTLRTGKTIAKTAAGEWAIKHHLCPVVNTLRKAIQIRKNPMQYLHDSECLQWCASIGDDIQKFADVLEAEIKNATSLMD